MLRSWIRRLFVPETLTRPTVTRRRPQPKRRWQPTFDVLEDRTVPSTSIPLSSLTWNPLGPAPITNGQTPGNQPVSGRITSIAADPFDPNVIFVGTAGGGVWRTTNSGATWQTTTDNVPSLTPTLFIGSVAVARSNTNVIYAGTGEASNSPLSFYGRGVLKSTDRGLTWQLLGTSVFDRKAISSVQVDPTNPNNVYVAVAGGGANGTAGGNGVFRSTDGGLTWSNVTAAAIAGSVNQPFSDLVIDPTNPQILYAAIGAINGSALNGVYKTTNGGASWSLVGATLPSGAGVGRIKVAIAANNTQRLFVSFSNPTAGASFGSLAGMYRTDNAGGNWTNLTPTTPNYMQGGGWYASTLAVNPNNQNVVYAGGFGSTGAFIQSTDGGLGWNAIAVGVDGIGPHADHHGIGFDANGRLLDGSDGGLMRLENPVPGSTQWVQLNGSAVNPAGWLNTIQFMGIGLHPTNADIAFGGARGNGLSQFQDSLGWTLRQNGEFSDVAFSQQNPLRLYAGGPIASLGNTAFFRRSDNGGGTWTNVVTGITATDPSNPFQPFVVDPNDGNRLVFGTNRVYLTTNGGTNWAPISTVGANGWVTNAPIDALAIARSAPQTIYASAGGRIYVTTNNGGSWTERLPLPSTAGAIFTDIEVDPTNSQTVFVTTGRFREGQITGSIFRSTNGGASWTDITANLPNTPTWTIAIDPRTAAATDDVYYVGTDVGVYASFDQGTSWFQFGVGMPTVQVRDLEFNAARTILAAGTHGRGMWQIIPDAQPVNISIVAGSPQSTQVTTNFATNLQVLVTNQATGLPINNFAVIFTAPPAGASARWAGAQQIVVFTNAAGIATAPTLTANTVAGTYNVTASSVAGNSVNFVLTNTPGPVANIIVSAGSPQSTIVNTAFATNLAAQVTDAFGNGIAGSSVTFTAPAGPSATGTFAGGVSVVTVTADANGVATAPTLTANTVIGNFTVTATTPGVGGTADFNLTNLAGAPATIVATAGSPQSTIVNTLFATALQAQVFDQFGNPVSGASVTFNLPGSGPSGTFAGSATVVTNAAGLATANALTANTVAGTFQVDATVAGVGTPASYTLTNLPGAAALFSIVSGTPQSQIITLPFLVPLAALVTDQFGNPIAGANVTFTAPGAEPTGTFSGGFSTVVAVTNAAGIATAPTFTAGSQVGSYQVTATTAGVATTLTYDLTNFPITPGSIQVIAGSPQSTVVNTAFATNLRIRLFDLFGNPMANQEVTFTAPSAGPGGFFQGNNVVITDADGYAEAPVLIANTVAGNFTATASVVGLAQVATFDLTNLPGQATQLIPVAGSPQSTVVNTAFATNLQVLVTDLFGNAVAGVSVTFTVPTGAGPSGRFGGLTSITVVSDANGLATATTLTANTVAGQFEVSATADGVFGAALFSLTNTQGAAIVTPVAGTPQGADVFMPYDVRFRVRVADSFGNIYANTAVTFTAPASGPSGVFTGSTTVLTDENGFATAPLFTANGLVGTFNVTASSPGATSGIFVLTNRQGAVRFRVIALGRAGLNRDYRISVVALLPNGQVATGYRGTIMMMGTAGLIGVPLTYTFTGNDAGIASFTVRGTRLGRATVFVRSVGQPFIPMAFASFGVVFGHVLA